MEPRIIKGHRFLCKKTVVMKGVGGKPEEAYTKARCTGVRLIRLILAISIRSGISRTTRGRSGTHGPTILSTTSGATTAGRIISTT